MNTQPDVFSPAKLGPLTLRNRIIKAATFEAASPDALVTDDLINYHRRPAAGGVGMTTVAYCAVSMDGRVQRNTLVMDPERVGDLTRLTDAVHAEGAAISAQLGHAGLVAQNQSKRNPSLAPSTRFSLPAMGRVQGATRAQLDEVVESLVVGQDWDHDVRVVLFVRLRDGRLYAVARTHRPLVHMWSSDEGKTWTKPVELEVGRVLPDLVLMSNGVLACAYGRPASCLMFSLDGGKTWPSHHVISDKVGFNYTSIREISPGKLLYIHDAPKMSAVTVDVERVK